MASTGSWACTASATNIFRYTVLGAGTQGSFGGAAWAAGCYNSSGWEPGVAQTMQQVGAWIAPISNSILNTYASSSYVTGAGNSTSSVSYVATKSTNNLIEYIHVLNPPSSKTLNLPVPADSKSFSSAILLSNGQPVTLLQNGSGVNLTLTGTNTWSSLDTVIALSVSGSAPTIFSSLTNQSVLPGNTASLNAVVLGATGYQWQSGPVGGPYTNLVNGGQISGATSNILSIANVTSNNAMTYQLVATNSYGSVTSAPPITLTVDPATLLINGDFGSTATQSGAAVLGSSGDLWNAFTASTTGTVFDSTGRTNFNIGLSLSDNGLYTDTGGSAMDAATTALMEEYAYGSSAVTVSLSGLNEYINSAYTLVYYV